MPNIQTYRDYHYDATAKVSENTRTLAIAEFAIIWIFITKQENKYVITSGLVLPIVLIIAALALDFLQYLYRSIVFHYIFRKFENQLEEGKIDEEKNDLYVTLGVNTTAYIFFYLKAAALLGSYLFLGIFLFSMIKIC